MKKRDQFGLNSQKAELITLASTVRSTRHCGWQCASWASLLGWPFWWCSCPIACGGPFSATECHRPLWREDRPRCAGLHHFQSDRVEDFLDLLKKDGVNWKSLKSRSIGLPCGQTFTESARWGQSWQWVGLKATLLLIRVRDRVLSFIVREVVFVVEHFPSWWTRQCGGDCADELRGLRWPWWRQMLGHRGRWSANRHVMPIELRVRSAFGNVLKLSSRSWNLKSSRVKLTATHKSNPKALTDFVCFTFRCAFKFCSDELFNLSWDEVSLKDWNWLPINQGGRLCILLGSGPRNRINFVTVGVAEEPQSLTGPVGVVWRYILHARGFRSRYCGLTVDRRGIWRFLKKQSIVLMRSQLWLICTHPSLLLGQSIKRCKPIEFLTAVLFVTL